MIPNREHVNINTVKVTQTHESFKRLDPYGIYLLRQVVKFECNENPHHFLMEKYHT